MTELELASRANQAVGELREIYQELRGIKGIRGAVLSAPYVVSHVEKLGKLYHYDGMRKKALAVEIIMRIVPLPWWLPEVIFRPILGWIIEKAVSEMKRLVQRF